MYGEVGEIRSLFYFGDSTEENRLAVGVGPTLPRTSEHLVLGYELGISHHGLLHARYGEWKRDTNHSRNTGPVADALLFISYSIISPEPGCLRG